jgi:ankyrin repeat protein
MTNPTNNTPALTSELQNVEQINTDGDDRFLPASSPWLARYFRNAAALLGELQEATDLSDFSPDCIDDEALAGFIDRLATARIAMPDEQDEDEDPPLELVVLCRALSMLQDFLELEQSRRKDDPEYAAECKGANETKRYRDTHNGAWPPAVLGSRADG